jgi:putative transposase
VLNITNVLRAYKYRIKPTREQDQMLEEHFGACRFVYNRALEEKTKVYQSTGSTLTCNHLINQLVQWKEENSWLKGVNAQALQMTLRNLDNAYTRFFREKKGFPKFKSKHNPKQSFQCPQACSVDWESGTLSIPKVKRIKAMFHRRFDGKIKTVTISRSSTGKYYASILVEDRSDIPEKPTPDRNDAIGIDVGLSHFLTTSEGEKIDNPRHLRRNERKLAKLQRSLSRKKKGSSNRQKAKHKVARLHERVANQRKDFLHKVSHKIVRESQGTICVEDLCVKGMIRNRRLAKSISDAGWAMFRSFLSYKADWNGKNILDIGRFEPSSKMCHVCGTINRELKLSDRRWLCPCGAEHDRDINAAINIKLMAFSHQNLVRCIGLVQADLTPVELSRY